MGGRSLSKLLAIGENARRMAFVLSINTGASAAYDIMEGCDHLHVSSP